MCEKSRIEEGRGFYSDGWMIDDWLRHNIAILVPSKIATIEFRKRGHESGIARTATAQKRKRVFTFNGPRDQDFFFQAGLWYEDWIGNSNHFLSSSREYDDEDSTLATNISC